MKYILVSDASLVGNQWYSDYHKFGVGLAALVQRHR